MLNGMLLWTVTHTIIPLIDLKGWTGKLSVGKHHVPGDAIRSMLFPRQSEVKFPRSINRWERRVQSP